MTILRPLLCVPLLALAATPLAAQRADTSSTGRALARATAAVPAVTIDVVAARPIGASQEPGRETRRGAIIGAIVGGVTGLGIGTFIALFCEAESMEGCAVVIPVLTLVGAGGGALAGAIVGAAIPRAAPDPPRAPEPPDRAPPEEEPAEPRRRIGTASAQALAGAAHIEQFGPGFVEERTANGAGVRMNLFAEVRPWLAIGPELGQAWLEGDAGAIRYVSAALRATWPAGRIAPYLVGDLGLYQWTGGSREYLGGGVGAGARYAPAADGRWFLDLGVRWQQNAQNIEHVGMSSLALGLGTEW